MGKTVVYISRWSKSVEDYPEFGLAAYEMNKLTGELKLLGIYRPDIPFGVLYYDKRKKILYALEERSSFNEDGSLGGRIFTFNVNTVTGELLETNRFSVMGTNPSYISLDDSGEHLLVSIHGGNSAIARIKTDERGNFFQQVDWDDAYVELIKLDDNGIPSKITDIRRHTGSGPERRQKHARPHTTIKSPDGTLYAVNDKGNDTLRMYKLEQDKIIDPVCIYKFNPGTLPRYCVFNPDLPYLYCNCENSGNFFVFKYEGSGNLELVQKVDILPSQYELVDKPLEQQGLVISNDGNYIYDVVRGLNSIVTMKINRNNGMISVIGYSKIDGKWPRGCAVTEDSKFIVLTCIQGGKVEVRKIKETGIPEGTGFKYDLQAASFPIICHFQDDGSNNV